MSSRAPIESDRYMTRRVLGYGVVPVAGNVVARTTKATANATAAVRRTRGRPTVRTAREIGPSRSARYAEEEEGAPRERRELGSLVREHTHRTTADAVSSRRRYSAERFVLEQADPALQALCRACGLCCDGSLFGRAGLDSDELDVARRLRLRVVSNGASFEQPCAAFSNRACTAYDERPRSCRRFVCRLHERARSERRVLDVYLPRVERARELLAHLAMSGIAAPELATLLDEDFARA